MQVLLIVRDLFGDGKGYQTQTEEWLKVVNDRLCREYGVFKLTPDQQGYLHGVAEWFMNVKDIEQGLDFIEQCFRVAAVAHGDWAFVRSVTPVATVPEAQNELNTRFREHGIGFQLESDEIIRVDSNVIHDQVVRPALHLLSQKGFAGPNQEYLRAHEHYRHGRHGESINECLKAFESVLKVVCSEKNWKFDERDTAKTLIDIVFANHLLPPFLLSQFGGLRSLLESGLPTTRNRTSGHGQGAVPKDVPAYLAAFALHASAANILLVVDAAGL